MPSSTKRLRQKFQMGNGNDGIDEAETVIKNYGGHIEPPVIIVLRPFQALDNDLADAIDFLCNEWDYSYQNNNS